MELLIALHVESCIAGGSHLIEDSHQRRRILSLKAPGGFLRSQDFQRHTNLIMLNQILDRREENGHTSMGVDMHQTIALQQPKCLAYRRRTHPKALRGLNLKQACPCRKVSRDDFLAERSCNLLRDRELSKARMCATLFCLYHQIPLLHSLLDKEGMHYA